MKPPTLQVGDTVQSRLHSMTGEVLDITPELVGNRAVWFYLIRWENGDQSSTSRNWLKRLKRTTKS